MPNELSKGEISPRITLMRGAKRRAAKLFLSNKNTQYTWTSRLVGTLKDPSSRGPYIQSNLLQKVSLMPLGPSL